MWNSFPPEHDAPARFVERILSAKRAAPDADTTALERESDERLYRLHLPAPRLRQAGGLAAEIQIAEEGAKR